MNNACRNVPNSVSRAHSDPLGNRAVLLLLYAKGSLCAEGLVRWLQIERTYQGQEQDDKLEILTILCD